ncbi:DUF1328 domain-containing protein [Fluoribacter gormanii]|uniref:UPF0391 membrane protein NCTC11401_00758 n=1 Tax=Fluoribacter gormanii TaxID=464 RepID=A0A377GHT9_9GAMM|nr:DUF1328 family protein [Fluoribacter gormanii]KTD05473.1 transmembrane protein [Fluoribacter gormanii]MCW8444523.1 DUF1328 domain-containing protein [Fluoribacter gormanii]MCW8469715.1 DUF1328 domain-containing protein [Fluoribacter gormanii]SIR76477.1 Protein of unknown function [Fluoribacter gormanii]STO23952.1 Small integral membrane protein [Fluoribacter gormanii]
MLTAAFIFLVIAIVSGYMGYKGTDPTSIFNAKIVFYISTIIFIILLIIYFFHSPQPVVTVIENPLLD